VVSSEELALTKSMLGQAPGTVESLTNQFKKIRQEKNDIRIKEIQKVKSRFSVVSYAKAKATENYDNNKWRPWKKKR